MRGLRAFWLCEAALVATVLAACSQRATSVTVILDTNARERVQALRIRTARGSSVSADAAIAAWGADAGASRRAPVVWPATFALVAARGSMEAAGTSLVALEVEVDYAPVSAGQPVRTARRGARFSFLPRAESVLRLVLNDSCASLVAPPAQCRDASAPCTVSRYCEERSLTCGDDGRCVTVDVTPVLPEDDGGADVTLMDATDVSARPDGAITPRVFFAPAGAAPQWSEVMTAGEGPMEAVRGVFTVPGSGELDVLTQRELFVLRLSDRRWIERHALADALPGLDARTLWEVSPWNDGLTAPITFVAGATAPIATFDYDGLRRYTWTQSTRRGAFVRAEPYGALWMSASAPPRWELLAVYYAPDNRDRWVPDAMNPLCGRTVIGEHVGVLSWDGFGPRALIDTVLDVPCQQFVAEGMYGSRAPYSATAPFDPWSVRGAAWESGFWVLVH